MNFTFLKRSLTLQESTASLFGKEHEAGSLIDQITKCDHSSGQAGRPIIQQQCSAHNAPTAPKPLPHMSPRDEAELPNTANKYSTSYPRYPKSASINSFFWAPVPLLLGVSVHLHSLRLRYTIHGLIDIVIIKNGSFAFAFTLT